jgi:hypothetical protein
LVRELDLDEKINAPCGMSIRVKYCVILVGAFAAFFLSGCVMQRTVKEDGVVVEKGYVVGAPPLLN